MLDGENDTSARIDRVIDEMHRLDSTASTSGNWTSVCIDRGSRRARAEPGRIAAANIIGFGDILARAG
jgi:hypothetical protein